MESRLSTLARWALCPALLALLAAVSASGADFEDTEGQYLDVMRAGKPLVRYMYAFDRTTPEKAHDTYKVYCHVMAPDGTNTLTKGPGHKFTHHRGIFLGWNKVSHKGLQSDLWHLRNGEAIRHNKILKQEADKARSILSTRIDWFMKGGEVKCLEETRTLTVHHTDEDAHLLIDVETELKAIDGDVDLKGDPEHAGFQYRPHQDVQKVTYSFHEEGIDPKKDHDLPWAAESHEIHGNRYTVQHMNHPDNPKGSKYSAYRDYGRFGCFPTAGIKDGESLKLKFRLRITEGEPPARETLAAQYRAYVE